ncbi:hypothetical protein [Sinisalibacter lacisalsi]|uniref:DUF2029 domain-containing protein n=1 Tax=Sinisalibacter lacisalsi TaxID=1526570 RepID=A0ABQ1QRT8_9RHOB|nr:hypothetical protein [Sinisalibacter lacisalsi]GGD39743.1 hypothetical protein GCM10011358_24620 [Sinisalibacter lacisalsi]
MGSVNRAKLGLFLLAVLAVLAGATLAKGGFYIGKHEGDTLHLLQIVLREAQGQWPHLDFQTPIGVLATAPIALFVKLGFGAGMAILLAQVLVAAIALPAIWRVAESRFPAPWAYIFGGFTLVLILALVHGATERSVSISMHYNRWAWAAAYLAIATAMIAPRPGRAAPTADGLVIGVALAFLALVKVTYFAAFALPVAVALIGRRDWRALVVTLLAGLAVALAVTLMAGTPLFWLAYLRDLATVAGSEVRPQPGLPFAAILGAPAYMGGSLALIFGVIFLRQAGRRLEGLVLLLLVPGFFYVQFQNYGNDPQWLGLLGLLLVTLKPAHSVTNALGWDVTKGLGLLAAAVFAFAAPSAFNLAYSPFRHLVKDVSTHTPVLPGSGIHEDLRTARVRALRVDARQALDGPGSPFAAYFDASLRPTRTEWNGETWPDCMVENGLIAWHEAIAADLLASGLAEGKTAFAADVLSGFWIFGAFEPLPGASPWYYGGLPGFEAADYLIVPRCPVSTKVRGLVFDAVDAAGTSLTEVRRNDMYVLYAK